MKAGATRRAERTIRRYDNRKLYDAEARRYVTLDELSRLIGGGTEVRVVEQRTGEDITTVVLAQVVLEGIKQRTATIPHQVLSRLIRLGSGPASASSFFAARPISINGFVGTRRPLGFDPPFLREGWTRGGSPACFA